MISLRALHRPARSRTARNRYLTLPIMREGEGQCIHRARTK